MRAARAPCLPAGGRRPPPLACTAAHELLPTVAALPPLPGRCYPIWMDFSECMSKAEDPKACKVPPAGQWQRTCCREGGPRTHPAHPNLAEPGAGSLLRMLGQLWRACPPPLPSAAAGLPGRLPGVPAPPQGGAAAAPATGQQAS